ncbi:hypothetical protein CEXT_303421 [Caerostris extrusa]|uniref:Uncharacterized protein n=1 Tax=Caerostris extrusa TaxID=172846 RepID=A0AAV4TSP1_CAEEX|nr:hypothetical protein CEXT_303421 [Caerostris extrusa]
MAAKPLLLAYINGNGNLCRALVRAGACLGSCNRQGINIFNNQVATKQLLYRLLDYLPRATPWVAEGERNFIDALQNLESKLGSIIVAIVEESYVENVLIKMYLY